MGIGAVLAVLVAALGYVFGPKTGGSTPGTDGTETRTEGDATARPLPVNALLGAPLPSPRGSLFIRGSVLGLDGRPVAGAVVVATAPPPDETSSDEDLPSAEEQMMERQGEAPPQARTTTDSEGRFSLEELEEDTYALWADGSFGTVLREDVPAGSEGVELRVGPGMRFSGHVQDENGNPIEGALVTVLLAGPGRYFDTLSDARGDWRLGTLPVGLYALVVTHAGFLPEYDNVSDELASSELKVTLYRPLRLFGRVLREGRPVAGARVRARGNQPERETSTDAQGRFTFEGLRPDTYQVSATQAELDAIRSVLLEPGREAADVLLELGTGARLKGTVRDAAGHPIADATVEVMVELLPEGENLENTALTASDGTYLLGPVPAGEYRLRAAARRYADSHAGHTLREGLNTLDFTLDSALLIEGRVRDAAGQPLPGVTLELDEEGTGEEPGPGVDATTSDEEGTFVLVAEHPVNHRLHVHDGEHLSMSQTVRAPSSGVPVVLRTGTALEGEVVDEKEAPLPGAQVLLLPEGKLRGRESQDMRQALTDERGRFTLSGLGTRTYLLSVYSKAEAGEEVRTLTRSIEVRGTEPVRVRLQLQRSGRRVLSGLVVDDTGKPIPKVTIGLESMKLEDPSQERWFQQESAQSTLTGADGHFELRGLPEGSYLLTANEEGHRLEAETNGLESEGRQGLQVRAGDTGVHVVLTRLGRIHGRLVRPDGSPVTRFTIDDEQQVDSQGAFDLPMHDSAPEELVFTAPGLAPTKREVAVKTGEVLELGEVVLSPGREVRGRVVDATTGAPVAGATVDVGAEPVEEGERLRLPDASTSTARDGTFTLPHVQERPLTLGVAHPDYLLVQLALGPGRTEVTVALQAGATLRGRVRLPSGSRLSIVVTTHTPHGGYGRGTAAQGNSYELRGLPAGTYSVSAWASDNEGPPRKLRPQQVEVPARGEAVLDLDATDPRGFVGDGEDVED
ncbi:carboxypeptidase regulatory-like domain-containing protein [Archangium sp.]|uniref:carboxypeptidase regulatory-like domain-containing protein n=1 Tax=Archangium sp. TaxID=1872627 RepID=UPI003899A629